MKVYRPVYILLTAVLISAPLLYFASIPMVLVRVLMNSEKNDNIKVLSTEQLTEADGEGKAFVHFKAILSDPNTTLVYLKIRPMAENMLFTQGDG